MALASSMLGCLVPQSVDPNTAKQHVAPRIVVGSIPPELLAPSVTLYPQGPSDLQSSPTCHCHLHLQIPVVEMDDYSQRLEVRWFIDYDPADPSKNLIRYTETLDYSFSGDVFRQGPVWDVEARQVGLADGLHVFDVVIVEENGFNNTSTQLPNRDVKSGYDSAMFRFNVNVQQQQNTAIPKCPSTSPSVRTCP